MVKFKVKASQKENWRYIGFEVISEFKLDENDITRAITNSIFRFFGEIGAAETNIWLIEYNVERKRGIFRCSNSALTKVLGAVTTIDKIGDKKAILNTLKVSGTIKKLRKKIDI